MEISGIHHITLISADARRTLDFYTGVLGLSLVKLTVNFDDPTSYHLYLGDAAGSPGTLVTFFEWPGQARGRPGIGGTHHLALQTGSSDVLLQWKRRLNERSVRVHGPLDHGYFQSIYFRDPDGTILEIATLGPGLGVDEPSGRLGSVAIPPERRFLPGSLERERLLAATWPEPVPAITPEMALTRGIHHISAFTADIGRTHAFYNGLLGLERVKMTFSHDDPTSAHWLWGAADGRPGTLVSYFERDPAREPHARAGAGQTHHFALAVKDAADLSAWREVLLAAGLPVTRVMDRVYFQSIYTRDPDGHIVELASAGPGFAVDDGAAGRGLSLPPWLEAERERIEGGLQPLAVG